MDSPTYRAARLHAIKRNTHHRQADNNAHQPSFSRRIGRIGAVHVLPCSGVIKNNA